MIYLKKIISLIMVIVLSASVNVVIQQEVKANSIYDAIYISVNGSYSGTTIKDQDTYYKFTVNKSGILTLTYSKWGSFDDLYIYDNSGEQIESIGTIFNNADRGCAYYKDKLYFIAGTYYIKIPGNCAGNYSLVTSFESVNESFVESQNSRNDIIGHAKKIKINKNYRGLLGINDSQDFYKFTMPFDGVLTIKGYRYSDNFSSIFCILDKEGNAIDYVYNYYDSNKDYGYCNEDVNLKKGNYYLKVDDNGSGVGDYKFKINIKPNKTYIKQIKRKKIKATINIEKIKGMTGYIVQYSTSEKFRKTKTKTKKTKKNKITINKLNKNKTYYIRVRAYKKWNGKIYYGEYSDRHVCYR